MALWVSRQSCSLSFCTYPEQEVIWWTLSSPSEIIESFQKNRLGDVLFVLMSMEKWWCLMYCHWALHHLECVFYWECMTSHRPKRYKVNVLLSGIDSTPSEIQPNSALIELSLVLQKYTARTHECCFGITRKLGYILPSITLWLDGNYYTTLHGRILTFHSREPTTLILPSTYFPILPLASHSSSRTGKGFCFGPY